MRYDNIALYSFHKFGDNVLRTAYSYYHNISVAENITKEVFLKLQNESVKFNNDEQIKEWLIRTTINICEKNLSINALNRNTNNGNASSHLQKILDLPIKYSTVVYLYLYEGYTAVEIARIHNKSVNKISSLLHRGMVILNLDTAKEETI